MARRRNTPLLEEMAYLFATLRWWVAPLLAAVVYALAGYAGPRLVPPLPAASPPAGTVNIGGILLHSYAQVLLSEPMARIYGGFILLAGVAGWVIKFQRNRRLKRLSTLELLRARGWEEIEQILEAYYAGQGYVVRRTVGGADGGVDLVLTNRAGLTYVQSKHWRTRKVSDDKVRELYGVMARDGASRGVVVTTGSFTQPARSFASGTAIELVDGEALIGLLRLRAVRTQAPDAATVQSDARPPSCPRCGAAGMVQKVNRRTGQRFWGCSQFPDCKGTKSLA
jgi:restriction system protein